MTEAADAGAYAPHERFASTFARAVPLKRVRAPRRPNPRGARARGAHPGHDGAIAAARRPRAAHADAARPADPLPSRAPTPFERWSATSNAARLPRAIAPRRRSRRARRSEARSRASRRAARGRGGRGTVASRGARSAAPRDGSSEGFRFGWRRPRRAGSPRARSPRRIPRGPSTPLPRAAPRSRAARRRPRAREALTRPDASSAWRAPRCRRPPRVVAAAASRPEAARLRSRAAPTPAPPQRARRSRPRRSRACVAARRRGGAARFAKAGLACARAAAPGTRRPMDVHFEHHAASPAKPLRPTDVFARNDGAAPHAACVATERARAALP